VSDVAGRFMLWVYTEKKPKIVLSFLNIFFTKEQVSIDED